MFTCVQKINLIPQLNPPPCQLLSTLHKTPSSQKKKKKNGHTQGHGWFGEPDDRILIEA